LKKKVQKKGTWPIGNYYTLVSFKMYGERVINNHIQPNLSPKITFCQVYFFLGYERGPCARVIKHVLCALQSNYFSVFKKLCAVFKNAANRPKLLPMEKNFFFVFKILSIFLQRVKIFKIGNLFLFFFQFYYFLFCQKI